MEDGVKTLGSKKAISIKRKYRKKPLEEPFLLPRGIGDNFCDKIEVLDAIGEFSSKHNALEKSSIAWKKYNFSPRILGRFNG